MINYSFIIPHKNSPQLLNRCVNSIPRRDDVEIIVVDDNSDPNVVDWKSFKFDDTRCLTLIQDHSCKGAGNARNVGIDNAHGRWLLFADADDYYEKRTRLTNLINTRTQTWIFCISIIAS